MYEKTGINYAEAKFDLLDECVRQRVNSVGVDGGAHYVQYVKEGHDGGAELIHLIEPVATDETFFFRHANQIKTFTKLITETIIDRRASGERRLKIWVAACSTGEEPYSLAMIVKDLIGDEEDWDVVLSATDIIPQHIEVARAARFTKRSVHHVDEEYVARYFTPVSPEELCYELCDEVVSMVDFHTVSLVDFSYAGLSDEYDIIFCRNVLDCFDEPAKKKVLSALYERLKPDGYLALGPDESLRGLSDTFQRCAYSVHNFFKKPRAVEDHVVRETDAPPVVVRSVSSDTQQMSQVRELVQSIDRGTRDIRVDIDSSLSSAIETLSSVADALSGLQKDASLPVETREKLVKMDQQFMQTLLFLQVGDRITQKSEALRAALQELSDYLLGGQREAPDLNVSISSFDENILPTKTEEECEKNAMSQDDIDALFGS